MSAAALLVWYGKPLPQTLIGLRTAGPYAALAVALALAWWFNRGRSFVIAASLLGSFAAWQAWHTKAVYTALVVLVPANAVLAMLHDERGARYRAAYGWLALLALEAALLVWIVTGPPRGSVEGGGAGSPPPALLPR